MILVVFYLLSIYFHADFLKGPALLGVTCLCKMLLMLVWKLVETSGRQAFLDYFIYSLFGGSLS